jgi:hypothetical protein
MANPRLQRKGVVGKSGFKAADAHDTASVPPPASPEDDQAAAEQREREERERREAAETAARDQAEADARERAEQEAEQARKDAEAAAEARRVARERAEQEAREREARERAEREAREASEREARERSELEASEPDEPAGDQSKPKLTAEERARLAELARQEAEEREARARQAIEGDQLKLDLGRGDTLTIDLVKAKAIQGSDNRQRNVQVPPKVAAKVRKEAGKTPNDTHVLVFFRALSKAIREPEEFGKKVAAYRAANAVTDPLLGITIASGKRTRNNPVKLQYNPTPLFDDLLVNLADQLKLSKALFVSLLLVNYFDMDVDII